VSPEKGIDKGNCPRKKPNIACRASRKWYQQRKFSNECVQHPPAVDKREGTRKDMNHYARNAQKL
jgi:hypothetical protein